LNHFTLIFPHHIHFPPACASLTSILTTLDAILAHPMWPNTTLEGIDKAYAELKLAYPAATFEALNFFFTCPQTYTCKSLHKKLSTMNANQATKPEHIIARISQFKRKFRGGSKIKKDKKR
jgi:hypothetical protein